MTYINNPIRPGVYGATLVSVGVVAGKNGEAQLHYILNVGGIEVSYFVKAYSVREEPK